MLAPWKKSCDKSRELIEKQKHYFANKGPYNQAMVFPVVMYACESWTIKSNAEELMLLSCDVGGDSWESLGQQGDKPVNPKGNQSWIFIGRTDAELEAPILWPPDVKSWLRKDSYSGKDWRQEEKGTTGDKMAGWHHWFNGHEFEQAPGDGERQGCLACCGPLNHKESVTNEWLNIKNMCLC